MGCENRKPSGPNFTRPVSTKICLAWNFDLDRNRITNQIATWFSGFKQTINSWIPVSSNMQQMEIWLVILFLTRKKFHAKQIFVLSISMKLGTVLLGTTTTLKRFTRIVSPQTALDQKNSLLNLETRLTEPRNSASISTDSLLRVSRAMKFGPEVFAVNLDSA